MPNIFHLPAWSFPIDSIPDLTTGGGGGATTWTYSGSGLITVSGSADVCKIRSFVVSGGFTLAGSANVSVVKVPLVSGGMSLSGAAAVSKIKVPAVSGGLAFSGGAAYNRAVTWFITGDGGLIVSGSAGAFLFLGATRINVADAIASDISLAGQSIDTDVARSAQPVVNRLSQSIDTDNLLSAATIPKARSSATVT